MTQYELQVILRLNASLQPIVVDEIQSEPCALLAQEPPRDFLFGGLLHSRFLQVSQANSLLKLLVFPINCVGPQNVFIMHVNVPHSHESLLVSL